ncbi:methyl-accepting chemotaxis protein [Roseomonas sp. CECT 9278]|uniref:methyl-accepting chemotaxis protein n=1 Tax=Roseomonas sp. CECT 9278 TaxID=2845823 RepID=UPI001E53E813|nr:methyl-accepting chemotaxis protein [Roseomonas sp. CECT 9278]CAH0185621.1 hypothetical protein ROS9278_01555 [Roseomonas sp. CECT 9278]
MQGWLGSIAVRIYLVLGALTLLAAGGGIAAHVTLVDYGRDVATVGRLQERAYLAQRIDAGVYAVVMESRGLYMAKDRAESERFAAGLRRHLADIRRDAGRLSVVAAGVETVPPLLAALADFIRFRDELARIGVEQGAPAADAMGNNAANRANRGRVNTALAAAAAGFNDAAQAAAQDIITSGERLAFLLLAAMLGGALLAGGIALWLVRSRIALPLARLNRGMEDLVAGRPGTELRDAARHDEIGDMARALLVFRRNAAENDALRTAQENAREAAQQERIQALRGMADRLETETRQAVESIGDRIAAMADEAERMAEGAAFAATGTQTLAVGAQSTLDHSTGSAAAAEQMSASIREITTRVGEAASATRRAVAGTEDGNRAIAGLQQSVERIGEVARLISDIAARTNLLALNATIEAARAGDAGKGFAVVAGEVKSLAAQTARSTEEIGQQIEAVVAATGQAVRAVGGIAATVQQVDAAAAAIADAMQQQAAATTEIARAAAGAAGAARDMTGQTTTLDGMTRGVETRADALRRAARETEAAMVELRATLIRLVRESTEEVDRRRHPRLATEAPAWFETTAGRHAVRLVNLSAGGAAVRGAPTLPPGARGSLSLGGAAPVAAVVVDAEVDFMRLRFADPAAGDALVATLDTPAADLRAA